MFSRRFVAGWFALLTLGWLAAAIGAVSPGQQPPLVSSSQVAPASPFQTVVQTYCVTCHNQTLRTAGLALDEMPGASIARPAENPDVWERVIAKLRAGAMPPPGMPRPDAATSRAIAGWLESEIDRAWAATPNPGRTNAVHRLNRTEYNNASAICSHLRSM